MKYFSGNKYNQNLHICKMATRLTALAIDLRLYSDSMKYLMDSVLDNLDNPVTLDELVGRISVCRDKIQTAVQERNRILRIMEEDTSNENSHSRGLIQTRQFGIRDYERYSTVLVRDPIRERQERERRRRIIIDALINDDRDWDRDEMNMNLNNVTQSELISAVVTQTGYNIEDTIIFQPPQIPEEEEEDIVVESHPVILNSWDWNTQTRQFETQNFISDDISRNSSNSEEEDNLEDVIQPVVANAYNGVRLNLNFNWTQQREEEELYYTDDEYIKTKPDIIASTMCSITDDECPVCYEQIKTPEIVKFNCDHFMCSTCICNHIKSTKTIQTEDDHYNCHICRASIKTITIYCSGYTNRQTLTNQIEMALAE